MITLIVIGLIGIVLVGVACLSDDFIALFPIGFVGMFLVLISVVGILLVLFGR